MINKHIVMRTVHRTGELLKNELKQLRPLVVPDKKFFYMGHRLGEHLHYPLNLNSNSGLPFYKETRQMMEEAFLYFGLNAIEFDIRVFAEGDTTVYITHDALKNMAQIPAKCLKYLRRNTLSAFLEEFIQKKYYKDRMLGIELKSLPCAYSRERGFFSHDMNYMRRLISCLKSTLTAVLRGQRNVRQIRQSIAFACFDFKSLAMLSAELGPDFSLYQILTPDDLLKGSLTHLFYHNEPFWKIARQRLENAAWLTGVWFDPGFMKSPAALFAAINTSRDENLKIYLSTYYSGPAKIRERLDASCPLKLSGMVFELE